MKELSKSTYQNICDTCGACKTQSCFNLNSDLEHTFDLPEQFPQTYDGVRFTADAMDCALPISIDPHSGCSYNCLYCFSNNLMRAPDRNPVALQKKIREGSFYAEWPIRKLEAFLARDLKDPVSKAMYPLLNSGCPVQLGALGDPFDDLEIHSGWAKQAIPLFIKYGVPVRIGSKGGKALQRPDYLKLFEKSPDQFWVAFSIICNSDDLISKIDLKAPVTSERLKAMKRLTDMGVNASLRFRPFLPGVSDAYEGEPLAWKALIERSKEAGARAISFEYIFLNNTPTDRQRAMYRLMFRAMNRPNFLKEWMEMSGASETCRRASRMFKYEMTKNIRELCTNIDMTFGCSDPHFKEWNDTGCCCFTGNTEVIIKRIHSPYIERRNLLKLYECYEKFNMQFEVLCNGEWKKATPIKVPYKRTWYKITLKNGSIMTATDNHIHITSDGYKNSSEVKVGNFIKVCDKQSNSNSNRGTFELGKFVGLYLAEGSGVHTNSKDCFNFCFSSKEKDYYDFIYNFVSKLGGSVIPWDNCLQGSYARVTCYSKIAKAIINQFTDGENAKTKRLKNVCFDTSSEFRLGLVQGWMEGDGRKGNRLHKGANTTSKQLAIDMQHIFITLGVPISYREYARVNNNYNSENTQMYSINVCSIEINNNSRKRIAYKTDKIYQSNYHSIGGELYSQITSIELLNNMNSSNYAYCLTVDDGHMFQLANGTITHNCGMPESGDKWFSNWSRRQMSEVIVQARRSYLKGEKRLFTYNDWKPEWAHDVKLAAMVALGDWHSHRVKKNVTFGDQMRGKWNNPKHPRGPYHYFGKVLQPIGVDESTGDLIYEYKEWDKNFEKRFHAKENDYED